MKESAEENLLITRDRYPKLIVPNISRYYTMASAERLGIDTSVVKPVEFDTKLVDPPDTLKVHDGSGRLIFSTKAFLEFLWESQVGLNALQIARFKDLSSEEVLPIDAEGMMKGSQFVHFNRESYIFSPDELAGKKFGEKLESPTVYRTDWKERGVPMPRLQEISDYGKPYLGPDLVDVNDPHIFAPDDLLIRILDALGVEGYSGKWMEIELEKEKSKLSERSH